MDIGEQAEAALEEARVRAVAQKLFENMTKFGYYPSHIERRDGEDRWTNHLHALGPENEIIRHLEIAIQTSEPLGFGITYPFAFIEAFPLWVTYTHEGRSFHFAANV